MKIVFNNKQLAHVWSTRTQAHGHNANKSLFFNNDVIYSYGHHFPAAKIYDDKDVVLINSGTYSNTTAKHIRDIRDAVTHRKCLYVPNVLNPDAIENHEFYVNLVIVWVTGILSKRKHFMSSDVINQLNAYRLYCEKFDLKMDSEMSELLQPDNEFIHDIQIIGQENAKHNELRDKLKRERQFKKDEEIINRTHSNLHLWYSNDDHDLKPNVFSLILLSGYLGYDLIRVKNSEMVETHRGAEVPFTDAWILLQAVKSRGADHVINKKIGHFTIDKTENKSDGDIILTIGCHKISMNQSMQAFQHYNERVSHV